MGRSGTRWLAEIFNLHDNIIGSTEPEADAEFFYRYIKWNELPIDVTGIFNIMALKILNDWEKADVSVIASPPLSIDILEVFKKLDVDKIIWGVNDARFTVNSFYNKGLYKDEVCILNHNLAVGLQPHLKQEFDLLVGKGKTVKFNTYKRSFGRIIPHGEFLNKWKGLTQIGKISWLYNMYNQRIYKQLKEVKKNNLWIFKLEDADQNYDYYLKLSKKFNILPVLDEDQFLSIKNQWDHGRANKEHQWSSKENKEFELYTKDFYNIYIKL